MVRRKRSGMTLLELLLATAMMTTVLTAVAVLLRGAHASWTAQQQDTEQLMALHATVRHIVRHTRQATAVTALSAADEAAGTLSVEMPGGETYVWSRSSGTNQVLFGIGTADQLLAENITALNFTGYKADAVTETTDPGEIHGVECRAQISLPRDAGGQRSVACWVWLRSW